MSGNTLHINVKKYKESIAFNTEHRPMDNSISTLKMETGNKT